MLRTPVLALCGMSNKIAMASLHVAPLCGTTMLSADTMVKAPATHLVTPAVAVFRGSMALYYCVLRFRYLLAARRAGTVHWKHVTFLNVRTFCELAALGLALVSFSQDLATRLKYKLVSSLVSPRRHLPRKVFFQTRSMCFSFTVS